MAKRQRRWRRIPDEKRRAVIRLAAAGASVTEICGELALADGSVRNVLRPLGGVIRPELWEPAPGRLSLDDRVEIRIGCELGKSFAQIGEEIGRDRSTVWREVEAGGGRKKYAPMKAHRRACQNLRRPKAFRLAS